VPRCATNPGTPFRLDHAALRFGGQHGPRPVISEVDPAAGPEGLSLYSPLFGLIGGRLLVQDVRLSVLQRC
jgi:hypothetical protein